MKIHNFEYESQCQSLVGSILGLITSLTSSLKGGWLYRGQPNHEDKLEPRAFRPEYYSPYHNGHFPEIDAFKKWVAKSVALDIGVLKTASPMEQMALAQHSGLATRLLDWSGNPLVALFFCCEELNEEVALKDGGVFLHYAQHDVGLHQVNFADPDTQGFLSVRSFDRRFSAQNNYFTYHATPGKMLPDTQWFLNGDQLHEFEGLHLVKIPGAAKLRILEELHGLGIHRASLFPDAEGLSALGNYEMRELAKVQRQKAYKVG